MAMTSTGFRQGWRTWLWGRFNREAVLEAVGQPEGGGRQEPGWASLGQREGRLEAEPWASEAKPLLGPRGLPGAWSPSP